ncbi:DUF2608 domain-containing protein [Thiotrichales bacterium 19X7-9]|nr:DUF2608 domain-containing protein [Thiotrichales bacterium 19X7-9]
MRLSSFKQYIVGLCLSILVSISYANAKIVTITSNQFSTLNAKAIELANNYGSSHVLIVYDIDNTLLALNQNLGSDQWFSWQEHLLKNKPHAKALVANNFQGLLKAQGLLFELSDMHLTEKDIPSIIQHLKTQGYPMVVITSRGHDFDHTTLKALNNNDLNFSHSFNVTMPKGSYYPYRLGNLKDSGLTEKDLLVALMNKKPREVTFEQGVLFGAGQNKGILLKTLLAKSATEIKAVIFIDDSQKNITQFNQVMANTNLTIISIRYSAEDAVVKAFQASNKHNVTLQWQKLNQTLNEVFKSS